MSTLEKTITLLNELPEYVFWNSDENVLRAGGKHKVPHEKSYREDVTLWL